MRKKSEVTSNEQIRLRDWTKIAQIAYWVNIAVKSHNIYQDIVIPVFVLAQSQTSFHSDWSQYITLLREQEQTHQ